MSFFPLPPSPPIVDPPFFAGGHFGSLRCIGLSFCLLFETQIRWDGQSRFKASDLVLLAREVHSVASREVHSVSRGGQSDSGGVSAGT